MPMYIQIANPCQNRITILVEFGAGITTIFIPPENINPKMCGKSVIGYKTIRTRVCKMDIILIVPNYLTCSVINCHQGIRKRTNMAVCRGEVIGSTKKSQVICGVDGESPK